jgi:hypothetical protein
MWKGRFDQELPNPITRKEKVILGFFFAGTYLLSNYSLIYMSYLDHALGRNCKYLAAVLIGSFFSRVKKTSILKLPYRKIYIALFITTGVVMFTYFGKVI